MKEVYSPIFEPWKVRDVEIKNRIVLAPMGGTCLFGWMEPSHFDKEAAELLQQIADNNCGLIIPGIAPVRDVAGGRWLYENTRKFDQLADFMKEVHKTGAKLFVQLTAGFGRAMAFPELGRKLSNNKLLGLMAKPFIDVDYLGAAPSALPNRWADGVTSRPLTKKEIADIVYGFQETARLCKEAGVDGVEVHAVHEGYLLDQFTLPYTNNRKDEYGGSFENRYRFPVEIVQAIKESCGEDFPVSLRYSVMSKTKGFREGAMPTEVDGKDYFEVGRTMDESEKAAKYLQDAGYDMLNCDNGTYDAWYWAHPPAYMPQNCNLEDVAHIKKFVDIPVACAGKMDPAVAAEAIKNGKIDAMAVGRQFLTDPEWVTKLMNEEEDDIMPCICCHNGCFDMAKWDGSCNEQDVMDSLHLCRCALNPETMHTNKYKIKRAKKTKNVAVIGGGIGGMEAARVLTLRGHKVTLYEKADCLGGIFIAAAASEFKEKDRELIEWYRRQMDKLGIDVRLNTEVKDVNSLGADEIIVATGTTANTIPIPGVEKAMDACDYLYLVNEDRDTGSKKVDALGDNIVIVGGGLSGCEIAMDLKERGKKPVIVEMQRDLICVKNLCLANSSFLRDYFKANDVDVYLNTGIQAIREDGTVKLQDKNKKEYIIPADEVILSVGYRPNPVAPASRHVHLVGDCKKVGNLRTVIWGAWDVAMKI